MIHLYFFFITLSGFSLVSLPIFKIESEYLKMALSPFYGIFIPSIIIMLFHILMIPLSLGALLFPWIFLSLLSFYFSKNHLIISFKKLFNIFKDGNKFEKSIYFLTFLFVLGLFLRSVTREIWLGDGQGQLAMKALEWSYYGRYHLSEFYINKLEIFLSYPLYHVVGMTINQLIFGDLSPYTIKLFDTLYIFGIFLTSLFFFSNLIKKLSIIIFLSFLLTFTCRNIPSMVNSGYADIDILYYLFLSTSLILFLPSKNKINFFHLGLAFGLLSISKSEGIFRLLILLSLWFLFYKPSFKNYKNLLITLISFISIYLANKLIMIDVPSTYSPYLNDMKLSIYNVIDRFPLVTKGLYYSYRDMTENITKAYWPLSFILLLLTFINFYFKRNILDLYDKKIIKLCFFLLILFLVNTVFNIAPTWLAPLPADLNLEKPEGLAGLVLVRLNGQIHFALTGIVLIGMIFFVKKRYLERTNKTDEYIIK